MIKTQIDQKNVKEAKSYKTTIFIVNIVADTATRRISYYEGFQEHQNTCSQ